MLAGASLPPALASGVAYAIRFKVLARGMGWSGRKGTGSGARAFVAYASPSPSPPSPSPSLIRFKCERERCIGEKEMAIARDGPTPPALASGGWTPLHNNYIVLL